MTSRPLLEAYEKVERTRDLMLPAGKAGEILLVRWRTGSGKMTKLHVPVADPGEIGYVGTLMEFPVVRSWGEAACGVRYPLSEATVVVEVPAELGVSRAVLEAICGTCLLLTIKPVRLRG